MFGTTFDSLPVSVLASLIFPFLTLKEVLRLRSLNSQWLEATNSPIWEPCVVLIKKLEDVNVEPYLTNAVGLEGSTDIETAVSYLVRSRNRLQHASLICEGYKNPSAATSNKLKVISDLKSDLNLIFNSEVIARKSNLDDGISFPFLQRLKLGGEECLSILTAMAEIFLHENDNTRHSDLGCRRVLFPKLTELTIYCTSSNFCPSLLALAISSTPNLRHLDIKCPITQSHRDQWKIVFHDLSLPLSLKSFHFPLLCNSNFSDFGFHHITTEIVQMDYCHEFDSLPAILTDLRATFGSDVKVRLQFIKLRLSFDPPTLQRMAIEFQNLSQHVLINQTVQISFPCYAVPAHSRPNALSLPTHHTCPLRLPSSDLTNSGSQTSQFFSTQLCPESSSPDSFLSPDPFIFPDVRRIELMDFSPLEYPMHESLLRLFRFPNLHLLNSAAQVTLWSTSSDRRHSRSDEECESIAVALSNHPDLKNGVTAVVGDDFDGVVKRRLSAAIEYRFSQIAEIVV